VNKNRALRDYLLQRADHLSAKIDTLSDVDDQISNIRLFIFLGGLAASFVAYLYTPQIIFLSLFFLFLGSFIYAAKRQRMVVSYLEHFRNWHDIVTDQLARRQLDWSSLEHHQKYNAGKLQDDINLWGHRSLLHLIDTTVTEGGWKTLTEWVEKKVPEPESIHKRARIVEELIPLSFFREKMRLLVSSTLKNKEAIRTRILQKWVQSSRNMDKVTQYLWILSGLAVTTAALLVMHLSGLLAGYWTISLFIYVIVFYQTKGYTAGIFDESYHIEQGVNSLSDLLTFLENYHPSGYPHLRQQLSAFQSGDAKPSSVFKKANKIVFWASLSQKNPVMWIILNLIGPWDFYFARRLERFKALLRPSLTTWLDALHELEALNALANFGYLNPEYSFAELTEPQSHPIFRAQKMGHPLLEKHEKVRNNYTLDSPGDISLITGSNMSGKSTFLRTIAINIKLAEIGAPVDAESLTLSPVRLFTCINISDSLNDGISYFYAEVKRLKELLDLLESDLPYPVCYCIDEIFRGTNNRERLAGSRALIKKLANYPAVGLISTHDLELVLLNKEIPQLSNYHFKEHIEDGRMVFDYKLRKGPSPTTNALKIMAMEGLPTS